MNNLLVNWWPARLGLEKRWTRCVVEKSFCNPNDSFYFSPIPSLLCFQLEERIDTLSKESRAHKTATEAAQLLIRELREELQQVRLR